MQLIFSFYFYCSPDPGDLHSFPTRRSSDLNVSLAGVIFECAPQRQRPDAPRDEIGEHDSKQSTENRDDQRSEEHTSELQSRFDLVCRLLLEKKNKNTDMKKN